MSEIIVLNIDDEPVVGFKDTPTFEQFTHWVVGAGSMDTTAIMSIPDLPNYNVDLTIDDCGDTKSATLLQAFEALLEHKTMHINCDSWHLSYSLTSMVVVD